MIEALDRAHTTLWDGARQTAAGRALWASAGTRAAWAAIVGAALALAAVAAAPAWVLLLSPLLLGAPHLASDVRWLVMSPPTPNARGLGAWLLLTLGAMTLVRQTGLVGAELRPVAELGLGLVATAGALLAARSRRAALGVGLLGAVGAWGRRDASWTAVLIGHLHNLIAIVFFVVWLRPRAPLGAASVVATLLGAALILAGGLDFALAAAPAGGLTLDSVARTLAPGVAAPWAGRLVLLFAYAQLLHYVMWLDAIPAVLGEPHTPRPPSESWSRWWQDLGAPLAVVVIAASVLIPALAVRDPASVRASYLSLALFHGWLEIAVGAHRAARAA
jgi:hypothetical protein